MTPLRTSVRRVAGALAAVGRFRPATLTCFPDIVSFKNMSFDPVVGVAFLFDLTSAGVLLADAVRARKIGEKLKNVEDHLLRLQNIADKPIERTGPRVPIDDAIDLLESATLEAVRVDRKTLIEMREAVAQKERVPLLIIGIVLLVVGVCGHAWGEVRAHAARTHAASAAGALAE